MKIRISKAAAQAIFVASMAVASAAPSAQAQYMVIEGASTAGTTNSQVVCCQTLYVQDYDSIHGVNYEAEETQSGLASIEIITGLFNSWTGMLSALIGIPAILIALLRLFVRRQTNRKPKSNIFELPNPPAPSRFYRSAPAGRY